MIRTHYSHLTTTELLEFALGRDDRTPMEIELAQRLMLALDMVSSAAETGTEILLALVG